MPIGSKTLPLKRKSSEEVEDDESIEFDPVPGTLFWLTCPRVNEFVSRLEHAGFLQELKKKYCESESGLSELKNAHSNYSEFLKEFLSDDLSVFSRWATSNQVLEMPKDGKDINPKLVRRYGNAGDAYPNSIKCLHSHITSYLIGVDDVIGKETFEKALLENDIEDIGIRSLECKKGCVKCETFDFEKSKKTV